MGTGDRWKCILAGALAAAATVLVAVVVILACLKPARAQSLEEGRAWIHVNGRDCCPHQSCYPAPGATLTRDGWRVPGMTGTLHPLAGRTWPFRETYACYYPQDPAKTLRCIFAPVPEAS